MKTVKTDKAYFPAFILILVMLCVISVLISCSGSSSGAINGGNTNNTESGTDTGQDASAKEIQPPTLPDKDYGGYTVRFLTGDKYNGNFRLNPDNDGDTLNDATYMRNLAVSERFNVAFEVTEVDLNSVAQTLKSDVMAGDDSYTFVLPHATVGVAAMVTDKLLYNWNDLDYVDFTKPWWNSKMGENLGIADKLYYASGDIVMAWQGMLALLFNKSYLTDYHINEDLYELVFSGNWTVDEMTKLIKGVSKDIDGDGVMSDKDQYGLLENKNTGYGSMFSMGQRITEKDAGGYPRLALNTERMAGIVNNYYNIVYSGETFLDQYSSTSYATSAYRSMLIGERSFLTELDVGSLYNYLREIEFEFGILPLPKYDEAQKNYYSFCGAGLIGIPVNAADTERTAVIAEELAYQSYKYLRPAFFDVVLENKAVRDENSYKVLQMMHENKVFDFGFNFDSTGSAYNMLRDIVITNKSTDFASFYTANENAINSGFEKIFQAIK